MKIELAKMYTPEKLADGRKAVTITIANYVIATSPYKTEDGNWVDNVSAADVREALNSFKDRGVQVLNMKINCPGGNLMEGLAIYDAIKASGMETHCEAFGLCASAATLFLCAADHRTICPNTTLMVHQPEGGIYGTPEEIAQYAALNAELRDRVFAIYAEVTGKSVEQLRADHERARWYVGQEAVDYGWAHALSTVPPVTGAGDGKDEQETAKRTVEAVMAATATLTGGDSRPTGWRAIAASMGVNYFQNSAEAKEVQQLKERVAVMTIEATGMRDTINALTAQLADVAQKNEAVIEAEVVRRVATMGVEPGRVPAPVNDAAPVEPPVMTRAEYNALPLSDRIRASLLGATIKD